MEPSISDIDEDLLLREIFLRFPIKTLSKLRVVCKAWNSMLSSPSLIAHHLNSSTRRKFCIQNQVRALNEYFVNEVHAPTPTVLLLLTIRCARNSSSDGFETVGAVQGVICLASIPKGVAILWNPLIHKHVFVRMRPVSDLRSCELLGFGFCSSNNDFKLVRIELGLSLFDGPWSKNCDVFSVDTDICRKGKIPDHHDLCTEWFMTVATCYPRSLFTNGNIHWVVINKKDKKRPVFSLLVFNCETEKFSTMELPPAFSLPYGWVAVWKYKGLLSVLKYHCHFREESYEVLLMREYGVSTSWGQLRQGRVDVAVKCFNLMKSRDAHVFEESMCLVDLNGRVFSSFNQSSTSLRRTSLYRRCDSDHDNIVVDCDDPSISSLKIF